MISTHFGGMPAAVALSFAIHAAALAGGLLLVGWERPAEIGPITVELVTLPARGSLDGSAAERPSPVPARMAEPETASAVPAPDEAVPVEAPAQAAPEIPPPIAPAVREASPIVTAMAVPEPKPESARPLDAAPVAHPPVPRAKPASPLDRPAPAATAAGRPVDKAVRTAHGKTGADGGAGPARGLSREAMSLPGNPAPDYPLGARRQGIEGQVILRLLVSASGALDEATVRQSSGHAMLDRSALEAVRRWRFRPALSNGRPVATVIEVPITFRLDG